MLTAKEKIAVALEFLTIVLLVPVGAVAMLMGTFGVAVLGTLLFN